MRLEGMDYSFVNEDEQSTNSSKTFVGKNISILTALNDDMFRRLAPTVVVLVAIMVVGATGNILICYLFIRKLRKSCQNFLLLCLGMFDLLSSCVGVPSEIFDIRHYYMYDSAEVCKATRFLTTFPSLASILVLLVIAVDRYRKICKPLHHQIHLSHARIVLFIIVIIALIFSVPALYIYGHRSFPTPVPGVNGYDCSVDDAYKDRPYPLVYEGIFLVAFLICTIVLASIYIRIWLETRRHIKYLKTHATFGTGLLDEATTTTFSFNYEDSSLENIVDDNPQTGSKKSPKKSLRAKRDSSSAHRKRSNSTNLCDTESTVRSLVNPAAIFTDKTTPHDIEDQPDHAKSVVCNCKWQINDNSCDNDSKGVYGLSSTMFELKVLEKTTPVARTSLNSLSSLNKGVTDSNIDSCIQSNKTWLPNNSEEKCIPGDIENHKLSPNDRGNTLLEAAQDNFTERQSKQLKSHQEHCNENVKLFSAHANDNFKTIRDHQSKSLYVNDVDRNGHSEYFTQLPDSGDLCDTHPNRRLNPIGQIAVDNKHPHSEETRPSSTAENSCQNLFENVVDNCGKCGVGAVFSSNTLSDQNNELKSYDKNCSGTYYFSHAGDISQDECEYLEHGQTGQVDCQKDGSSISLKARKHNAVQLQSNKISFLVQSDDGFESADNMIGTQPSEFLSKKPVRISQNSNSSQSLLTAKRVRKALRATRTTIIAFAITIGFILSYLPHLILIILRSVKTDFEHHFDDTSLIVYNIFIRSYFANNVINVFVYGTMNMEFRTQIVNVWKRIKCSKK